MVEEFKRTWLGLERRQQISVIALAGLLVAGLVIVGTWAARPSWAVLYSELSSRDAQSVIEQLRDQGIPYRLAAGGTTVQVPQKRLYELRLQLAGEGLPTSSTVGFELFDRTSFSSSELQNNVNLQRALQGELERSICTLDEIVSARVHLAMPEERLFTQSQQQPSASVVVGLAGSRLSGSQVAAITQLVSSAVPALDPDAVTLVDTAGRVLSDGSEGAAGLQTMAQMEATRSYEESVRRHLQSMLDSVLGANRSVVRVQAALDFQRQQLTRESLEPADGQGVIRREEIVDERYEGRGAGQVAGPAGLTGRQTAEGADGSSYEHRQESREYDYSRLSEQTVSPPGRLQRLTVAVVLDDNLDGSVATKVRQLVHAAAGIDDERGDVVTVESMAIDAIKVAEQEAEQATAAEAQRQKQHSLQRALRYGSIIVMLAMIAGAMLMVSRNLGSAGEKDRRRPARTEQPPGDDEADEAPDAEPDINLADGVTDTIEFSPMTVDELQAETGSASARPDREIAERLSELGTRSPEEFARHLSGWLAATNDDADGEDDED